MSFEEQYAYLVLLYSISKEKVCGSCFLSLSEKNPQVSKCKIALYIQGKLT